MPTVFWGRCSAHASGSQSATHARPSSLAALAITLTYGVGFWLVWQHHLAGAHEEHDLPLALHWLRDSTLALPLVTAAVWSGLRIASRLWPRDAMAQAAIVAVAASVALGAGEPVHAWLFGAEEESDVPLIEHMLRDAFAALAPALLIAGAVTFERIVCRRSVATTRTLAWMGSGTLALSTVLLGGTGAWLDNVVGDRQATAMLSNQDAALDPDLSLLRDRVDPCFNDSPVKPPFLAPLPIPAPAEPQTGTLDNYVITEQRSQTEIIPGITTPVWAYNGQVPGPTILARKLRPVDVNFVNSLPPAEDPSGIIFDSPPPEGEFRPSSTVVHLHGINAEHRSDGYAAFTNGHEHRKDPGTAAEHTYPNNSYQRPATLWYHDHSVHITSQHIYRGLAGFYLLRDDAEDALPLPGSPSVDPGRGYGFFDIPLLLKDVMIDPKTGLLVYNNCSHFGAFGDVMTMNGKQQPRFDVANRKYRFRLLDGSDARQYLLAIRPANRLNDPTADQPFFVIGSDQGLLSTPELVTNFHVAPAERVEFVFDFSKYPIGTRLVMVNELVDSSDPKLFPIMAFDVTRAEPDASQVVGRPEEGFETAPSPNKPDFLFNRQGGFFSINSLQFDPNRVDDTPAVNTNEVWTLRNKSGGWGHPIHIHLGRFKILSVDGRPPRPAEEGWKDVVWLGPNQTIRVQHEFANFTGRFVFHCHNGSHEDHDMMSQFEVEPGGTQ
jgi:spore coat protein A, manganese oxidase